MIVKDLSVIIKCGYSDLAEIKDPALCVRVLALVASEWAAKPETPEQRLLRELEDKVSSAQSREYDHKSRADRLDRQVAELTKKLAELTPVPETK